LSAFTPLLFSQGHAYLLEERGCIISRTKVSTSRLRTFADIARFLPRTREGKKVHVSTLHRWRVRGHAGVYLRCVKTPSGWCTSLDAVWEFFEQLTRSECRTTGGVKPDKKQDARRQERVEQQLDTFGV
jgi:hypothetical protein